MTRGRCLLPAPGLLQAFSEVLSANENWSAPMEETYQILGVEPGSVLGLEDYLKVCVRGRVWERVGVTCVGQAGEAGARMTLSLWQHHSGALLTRVGLFSRRGWSPRLGGSGVLHQDHEEAQGGGRHLGPDQLLRLDAPASSGRSSLLWAAEHEWALERG